MMNEGQQVRQGVLERVYVVMPVSTEHPSIAALTERVLQHSDVHRLLVVVDRATTKQTRQVLEQEKDAHGKRLGILEHGTSTGVASCYLVGFKQALEARATAVIEMDADGSHDPKLIPVFLDALVNGYDCVFGSRFIAGGHISGFPLYRRLISWAGTKAANVVTGTQFKDMTSGYEGFRADVLDQLDLDAFLSTGHMFQTELRFYLRHTNFKEIPIHYEGGDSTLTFRSIWEALVILKKLHKQPNAGFVVREPTTLP